MTQELVITPSQLRRHRVTVFAALPPHLDRRTPIEQADEAAARLVRRALTVGFQREINAAVTAASPPAGHETRASGG